MNGTNSQTLSQQELRLRALLDAILPHATFDGWSAQTVRLAAREAGLSPGDVALTCPRGEIDLLAYWSKTLDDVAACEIAALDLGQMKIRDRVTSAVLSRLTALAPHEEAARRARARLLLPDAAKTGTELVWATSDMIWRAIGDTSTDGNFYSKRTILSAVYTATLASWLSEDDPEKVKARGFLDRRIADVMTFEKSKAQFHKMTGDLPDVAQMLGTLRYGKGPQI